MIFSTYDIVDDDEVERVCPQCGFADVVVDLCDEARFALVATTEFAEAVTELRLLRKTKALFDRFPKSRHPCVVAKLDLKTEPQPDDELQRELDEDPELKEFLQPCHGFYLPSRLKFCEERTRLPEGADRADIACPKCWHYLVLPKQFYWGIGSRPSRKVAAREAAKWRLFEAQDKVQEIVGHRRHVPCQLPDGTVTDVEECQRWLETSVEEGYLVEVTESVIDHKQGILLSRNRPVKD